MLRSEKGVSAVEFALIAPLLFVLTFGIVEFGILLFDKAVVTNASREGARAASVYSEDPVAGYDPLSESEIKQIVMDYAADYLINLGSTATLSSDDIDVDYQDKSGGTAAESGGNVTVSVNYTYDFLVFPDLTALLGGTFSGSIDLVGTSIMRME